MILTKEQILERRLPREAIDVGNDTQIMVRALPLHVIQQSQSLQATDYGSDAFLFSHAVVDDRGSRLYADADIPTIAQTVESALIQLVVSAAFRLARIDEGMLERIKKKLEEPGRRSDWRIAVSLGRPHPDLVFDELTPEQACELRLYAATEPFGEVRHDMRMAKLVQFYYEANRSKSSKPSKLGQFMLYSDFWEDQEDTGATEAALLSAIGGGSRGR